MPKNIAPRGNPIAMPTIDQPNHTANQNREPNHTRSNFIQGPQVGRNTLDAPSSSSNTSNTKGRAFGVKSLVLNKHRSEGNGRSAKAPRIANPSFNLSSFSAGVPSAGSKIKPLVMLSESSTPSVTTESADLPHHKQYRDASNAARIVHHSLPPTQDKPRKMQTRSEAKKPQANDETIVLDDSDDDDRQNNDLPSSSQSPQTHFHQVNGNGTSEEKDEPASGSPVESLTTTGDTEMEENRPAFQAEESIESIPKANSSPNGHTGHHFLNNSEEERKESHENTSSLPSAPSVLHKKSFVIAQPLDASRSRITDKMKGKDGQTKSMIDTRSTAKAKNHNDKYYSSGLNTRSNFSGISDKPIKLKLRKIAFDPDGFIGFEASPTVELTSSGESIEICWDEDGSGRKGQTTVINFNDCESLRASKDSSSMYPKPHRYLEIIMVEDCDTFNNVKELLEKILGFGAVRGSNRIILDAIQQDSREEHKWVELRKRLSKMRIRPLQDLGNNSAESIEELLKKLKPLTSTRVDQSSSINNFQTTPVPRPKARPSATDTSKYFVSSSSSNPLRTSDVRGTRHNDKDGKAQRDIAQRRGPPPVQSKSPSPKKALDPNKKLLSYPFHNLSPGYVTILQSDLDRLDPGEFLNDTIIDFGLKYLLEEIRQRDPDLCKEIFVFSSFFYNRLNEKKSDRKVGYELVKKWTRKAEFFKKKYIVVPINENLHWYLAILINPLFAIPQEIRNGKESDKEAIAGSEYNSARSSPRSGVEPSTEEDTTRYNDLFAGNISAQHQQVPEIDGDGDSNMFPVLDRRTDAETYQIYAHSDAISNNGGGTVEGGGGNQKRGNPIEPGQSFPENEDSKRSRTTISSRRHETHSPGKIATSSFYGSNGAVNTPSPESNPRRSPDLRRSARISGPSSPVNNFDVTLSRRSSMNLSQDLSQTWRKQLNEEATVCVFDSLQQKHSPVKTAMKHYLAYEYADKHNLKDAIDMKRIDLNLIDVTMPRQPNWADCGLYLLHAFERFFSDPETFKNDVIPAKNEKHSEWKSEEALDLRVSWKATIERLSGDWFAEQERRDQERLQKKAKGNGSSTTEDDLSDGKQEDVDDIEIGGTNSVEVVQSPGASSDATNDIRRSTLLF